MLYGLTGPSRSGKTTLARAVADDLGIEFYETSTAETAKRLGFNAVSDLSLPERLHFQTLLLQDHIEELNKRSRPLIVDRTPLDYMGYLACEFTMMSGDKVEPEVLKEAARFVDTCLDVTRSYYDFIAYLAPLPVYEAAEGKHPENPIYQKHHALTVMGGIGQLRDTINSAYVFETDHDVRLQFMLDSIVNRLDTIDKEKRSSIYLN